MSLRTCPICKAFSSAFNTTLNVHINMCLSVDSGHQQRKPRDKTRRKVKTMVDIYVTAKRCTLEDLDQRNATKWAVISSYSNEVVSDKNKPQVCKKRKNRSVVDEDASGNGIGPVYIDAKGQKLRIISEYNEKASDPSREHEEDVSEMKSSKEGEGNYERFGGKKYYKHCKVVPQSSRKGNASERLEYGRSNPKECRGMERSETQCPTKCRSKKNVGRNICDQSWEDGHSLSEDPLVSRGPSHASVVLSETVSSPLNSQNSWRSCGESQVSGKITKRERCSIHVDKVFASRGKSVMKKEEEDEDSGRWESEMTQDCVLTDYDNWEDNEDNTSTSGGEDKDYVSWEETGNNNIGDDTGCETEEQGGSTFMEVDPIPIPGPFLQSPWDMETDASENLGNFSVISSHVTSSQDQLDLTDRNSSESPLSNFAALETQTFSFHNITTTDKRPSGFKDNKQSCICQRKEKAFENTAFGQAAPHMIQQDLSLLSKSVPGAPSSSNSVLRLMGKDLMVINQSNGDASLKPTPQFQDISSTQHVSPPPPPPVLLLHRPYSGNALHLDFYNIS